ncbi:MAG: UDP-N-acetylmuramate dehydrogenase [Victivallaceae bacterium]|nr:UDP-N-acetylmuramate dehydrogenase [Victivallaceae bacterium]
MSFDCEQFAAALAAEFPQTAVERDAAWKHLTTLGVGGRIPLLLRPLDDVELGALLRFCVERKVKYFILGGGANVAGTDDDFDGVVITMRQGGFTKISRGRNHLSCGVGVALGALARYAAESGFGGITALAGIPGSVGGALRMNAGAEGRMISDFVVDLSGVLADGTPWSARRGELDWGYRKSNIPENVVLTAAIFELPSAEPEQAVAELEDFLAARRRREPAGRSAGCAFRNAGAESAGRLIDKAGLKELSAGGAAVSGRHANFVMNTGSASEKDFVELLGEIRKKVAETSGIYLRPEVVFASNESLEKVMNAIKEPAVLVLMGGNSSEREISLRSGQAVAEALVRAGYNVASEDISECRISDAMRRADVVFPALHGGFGENGELQKLMEDAHIRFVGCGSEASRTVMDKIASKTVMDKCGVTTAKWAVVTPENRKFPANLSFPVVVKAPCEGSSVGIKTASGPEEWDKVVAELFSFGGRLLVEEFVKGIEISVPIVNGKVLPPVEIRPPHGFYDYDAKYIYKGGHTEYFCPAESLDEESLKKAALYTERFFTAVGAKQLLRVDFIVDAAGEPHALEGNSLPGFTATSLVPKSAKVAGFTFERLCAELVQSALKTDECGGSR